MSKRGWSLFASLCVIWGIPYLFIKVAVADVPPPVLVFLRTGIAVLVLLPFAVREPGLRRLLPKWPWILGYTAAELAVPWLMLARAEQHIPSGLAGLLVATVPLLGIVVYRFTGAHEPIDARRLAGLFIGFAGVAALVGIDIGSLNGGALAEMSLVVLGYTLGPLFISRGLAGLSSLWVVVVSLGLTALVYSPAAAVEFPSHISGEAWAAIAVLAVVCTAVAFLLFFALIREVGPARSVVITYVNPAVAILCGVIVLGEPLTAGMAIGFPLVLIGCVLGTSAKAETAAEPVP